MYMNIRTWIEAMSPVTLTSSFSSVTLGFIIAWYKTLQFNPLFYIITLIGLLSAQAGVNLINDYRDYKSSVDIIYRQSGFHHRINPVIDLNLPPSQVKLLGYALLGIAIICGSILSILVGLPLIIIGIIGIFLGVAYTEPPFSLKYRGLGEITAAIIQGPLVVWGSFVVQTGMLFSLYPLFVGIINGAFTFIILLASSALKLEPIKKVGKKNLVSIIGMNNVKYAVYLAIAIMYLSLIFSSLFNYIPLLALISLATLPIAIKISSPLLESKEESIKKKWAELRKLWAGPFSVRIIILIIILITAILTKEFNFLDFSII